jgi:hypothetical protein
MTLAGIKKGDIVKCEVGPVMFYAIVTSDGAVQDEFRKKRGITLRPISRNVTNTFATAYQVVGHWRRSGKTPLGTS